MPLPVILSHYQAAILLRACQANVPTASVSPDLGMSVVDVALASDGVAFPTGERLRWAEVERISAAPNVCFALEADGPREIRVFSEHTGWLRALMPTTGAPTMLVAGLPMHRIKDTDPYADTRKKIAAIAPVMGRVLDTATGLGYTAIEAAKSAREVVTIELDPAGLEVARLNPWSQPLFALPNIQQIVGDAVDILPTLEAGSFSRIVHDPPMINLAGDLYSEAFYRELYRVLQRGGRAFHYIGDPSSPSGRRTTNGVIRRLQLAGFARVTRRPEAFGVVAFK